ncbi:beta-phosphoglucomutase [Bacillaceae bacterium IKA-2]|nr:beta-phosphoglucomutase [Bacillaceae bacterium IKA-2]
MDNQLDAVIFDLDGVITDTAEYHYLAWKNLANSLGIDFDKKSNEQLKGISRMESLEMILKFDKKEALFSDAEKLEFATKKNQYYQVLIKDISKKDILPGIVELLEKLKANNIKIALASASKNAKVIIEGLGLRSHFDVIVDVEKIKKGKPDPEIFLKGADLLGVPIDRCIGIEDAQAGVEAIKAANMFAVGVGSKDALKRADYIVETTNQLVFEEIKKRFLES